MRSLADALLAFVCTPLAQVEAQFLVRCKIDHCDRNRRSMSRRRSVHEPPAAGAFEGRRTLIMAAIALGIWAVLRDRRKKNGPAWLGWPKVLGEDA